MIYAVWDGEKIVTAPDFIFASIIEEEQSIEDGKMCIVKNYKESRGLVEQKLQDLQQQVKSLSRHLNEPAIKNKIIDLETEMQQLTAGLNKKRIKPFRIKWINNVINKIVPEMPSIAWYNLIGEAPTSISFNGEAYHILRMKHIYFLSN